MSPTVFTVYGLKDPRDGLFRYIGCTKESLEIRLSAHMSEGSRGSSKKSLWIQSLIAADIRAEMCPLIISVEAFVAGTLEKSFTDAFLKLGHPILSLSNRPYCAGRFGSFGPPKHKTAALFLLRENVRSGKFGITQIANAVHVSNTTVSLWIQGKSRPSMLVRERLAAVLDVPVAEWLTTDELRGDAFVASRGVL